MREQGFVRELPKIMDGTLNKKDTLNKRAL